MTEMEFYLGLGAMLVAGIALLFVLLLLVDLQ